MSPVPRFVALAVGTAAVAAIIGIVATASGLLDGGVLNAAVLFGAAGAAAGLVIASFPRRPSR
jgi:hypothetical protein